MLFAKYKKTNKVILKKVEGKDLYEVYQVSGDRSAWNSDIPITVPVNSKDLEIINLNRMGPRELRQNLSMLMSELVWTIDDIEAETDN